MKRLIFFVGVYDTLDLFTFELKREFEALQYETLIFDVRQMRESLVKLGRFTEKPVEAVITFNNLGFHMELHPGKNIWDELKIPCINILMDHPFCYHTALVSAPKNAVVLCTDRNHMNYVSRFYPNIPVAGYLPHAGKELEGAKKPVKERGTDVLYAGGLSRTFAEKMIPDLSKYTEFNVRLVCEETYQELILHPQKTTEQALEEVLNSKNIRCEEEELAGLIADLHFIDLYAVSYFREKTVRILAESGIELALYGAGWENCAWINRPNVHYGGRVAAEEIVKKMRDTKIVLNTMTWFKDGTHDRVFNGMLQGAVTVSDTSVYMKEEFCGFKSPDGADEREMVLFELTKLDYLPDQINELLTNAALAQEIADRGYKKARQAHTWRNRAAELKEDILDKKELMEYLHS